MKEVLEFNKRCADFMGLKISINPEAGYDYGTWYKPADVGDEVIPSPVLYHSDWNWLMEVVEAIEKLYDSNIYFKVAWNNVVIGISTQYELAYETGFEGIETHREKTKKEAVVSAINQFLIWHEQNN